MTKPKYVHWLTNDKARCCGSSTPSANVDITKVTCERCRVLHDKDEANRK